MIKKFLSITCLIGACCFFSSGGCITEFSIAYGLENQRHYAALCACSLLPNGGPGCVNHAYEVHDIRMQEIEDDYNCCEFNDC